ncbi:zinc finger C3HC4-type RING finger family protein [Striga asiatica]|uniref:RING-type E3 ubiquitin transferase n=1 Tax=Striga asiatica TaxID=4170 RepID=A0A5A7QUH3_STRAF|nr:zinc finger C3HC4-type RING finger family protein [Striga asiatica]
MANTTPQLPLDADGACMLCKVKPTEEATLTCAMCATPWHVDCLSVLPETMSSAISFECPDCSGEGLDGGPAPLDLEKQVLFTKIREIEADVSLSEREKARRRQELLSGNVNGESGDVKEEKENDVLGVLGESFKCCYCMELPERPVTTPCGHNFCLKCFEKWMKQGKRNCAKCRCSIPAKMASQPRINSALVSAIRMAKLSRSISSGGTQQVYRFLHNQDRPDRAFTTERAQKAGMANAASGRIFVTVPKDHFGPIPAESDPERNQGVLVGETWDLRMDVRQWGVHYPPVAGIAGQAHYGAQSVVISGGYEDDEDNGECGGRDLSGNKRTNKAQSFDQEFQGQNQSLRVSCEKGYPVRVVRSEKDKRSSYAPEKGYRYDGVYRIEKCWRKAGKQGFKVCRYLFVRCDNEPAPWTSDEHGDRPRELPVISELKGAVDVTQRKESPSWDYDEVASCWKWKRPPPHSEEKVVSINPKDRENGMKVIRRAQAVSMRERLLKGFCCLICKNVMNQPLTTPCAHNFCKPCLENQFAGQTFSKERVCHNGRKLRSQKNILNCPACPTDISEFLQNPQVNREIKDVIERLQSEIAMEEELKGSNTTLEETNAGEEKNDTLPGEIKEVIEKLQSEIAKEEEHKDSNTTSEEINAGEEKNDDTLPGADVGKKSNEQTEGQLGKSITLKRKGSSSSLSNEKEEINKKAKVDNGDESVLSSEEKKPDGESNNVLQASVTKRGRGRPRKGEPKC